MRTKWPGHYPERGAAQKTFQNGIVNYICFSFLGIKTGKCVMFNTTHSTCEIYGWCPVENSTLPRYGTGSGDRRRELQLLLCVTRALNTLARGQPGSRGLCHSPTSQLSPGNFTQGYFLQLSVVAIVLGLWGRQQSKGNGDVPGPLCRIRA